MFRMDLACFGSLCLKIIQKLGDDVFRSEAHLQEKVSKDKAIVPRILGEFKVAISIRILAGGSCLDLAPLFGVSTTALHKIFSVFLSWTLLTFEFPLVAWLRDGRWEVIQHLANQFSQKTDGAFSGPFGALDGLALRTKCPSLREVPDPGNYYCRKGFYALNVQAICDKLKRFLWCYPSNKGSTHDSAAFSNSRLFDLLKESFVCQQLLERGLFIAGDSAHSLSPFMIMPHDIDEIGVDHNRNKDSCNFHLSSCGMCIECAFGELVMRWGVFWRTLRFSLKKSIMIIQVCMLLHDFIVDYRQGDDTEDKEFFTNFRIEMDDMQKQLTRVTGEAPNATASDNNEPKPRGGRSLEDKEMREHGLKIRERLTVALSTHGLKRPTEPGMRHNSQGNVHLV